MNYYDQNMKILKKYNEKLHDGVKALEDKVNETKNINVYSLPAKDGNKVVMLNVNNQEYRLNSIYHPLKEAEIWCSQFDFASLGIVISMYGVGNGIFIRELIKKKGEEDILLVYEPCVEIFRHVIYNYDIADIIKDEKVFISVAGINEDDFRNIIDRNIYWTNLNNQIVCMHPQYDKIFMEESIKFLKIINDVNNQTIVNRNTNAFFGRDMVENTIKNLKYVRNAITIRDLSEEELNNVPAIIVSAGPSLDKNVHLLKKAKGKAVIVATDTAMRILNTHGIIPDVFVTLDALKPESYLDGTRFSEIPLFCKVESNWRILSKHNAKKILFSYVGYIGNLLKKLEKEVSMYSSGGSVATAAFAICAEMKFKKIIFIGQDLAFSGDKTHAGDISDHILGEEEGIRYIEGVDGKMVKTRHDWCIYLKWFEESIKEVNDIEVIDATEGGAKIHGTKLMTLQEAIDQYCNEELDIVNIINNKPSTLSEKQVKQFYGFIKEGVQEIDVIEEKARLAECYCEQAIKHLEQTSGLDDQIIKISEELEKINLSIETATVYKLIDEYMSDVSLHALAELYKFTGDEEADRRNTFKRAGVFYQLINSAVTAIRPMLEDAVNTFWDEGDGKSGNKPLRKVVIIQARVGSTRLKGKVMRNLNGKSILSHDIERIRQSKLVDDIVIATTTKEDDDAIVNEAKNLGVKVFRGSEEDVLSRYYYAAKETRADIVIRVTSDCPLIDPYILDQTIKYYLEGDYDIVTNAGIEPEVRTFPRGLDVEVFSYEKLRRAYQYAKEKYQREHVTPYLYENCSTGYYTSEKNYSKYRWTLDTEEDWQLISQIYQYLYNGKHDFYYKDILALMEAHPELANINNEVEQKKLK